MRYTWTLLLLTGLLALGTAGCKKDPPANTGGRGVPDAKSSQEGSVNTQQPLPRPP
jgi:hypothetical protein